MKNKFLQIKLIFILLTTLLYSCNKEKAFDCVKTTGKTSEKIIETEAFHSILLNDNIDLIIHQGPLTEVILKGGKNILPKIKCYVKDGILHIYNENSCNWVRKFENPKVLVTISDLKTLYHEGYGEVQSEGKLNFKDFSIQNSTGNGDITLDLDVENLVIFSHSSSLITLKGKATNLNLVYLYNYGRFHSQDLATNNISISHQGLNTFKVFPLQSMDIYIGHSGNVEYYNEPENMQSQFSSKGKLIKMF
ncbi:MAG: DUF2807 domain-containing protein [Bacteroidota bacterium]|nr:DUF2807 domain-containing protein [Bacteroidota bacterium]